VWNQQPAKVGWHIIFRTPELQGQGSADESSGWTVILWIHKGRDEATFKKKQRCKVEGSILQKTIAKLAKNYCL